MKKKIFGMTLVVCIVALSIAGASMAYFTDVEEVTNIFTAGNVDIELSEAAVLADAVGNLVKDEGSARLSVKANESNVQKDYGTIFPSQSIFKDPTIKNVGSEKAYVGAIITVTNDDAVSDTADITSIVAPAQIDEFITGLNFSDADVRYEKVGASYKIYVLFAAELAKDQECTVFTGMKIFNNWNNAEMAHCKGLNVSVKAYAAQTAGFADSTAAITTAFDDWAGFGASVTLPVAP